MRAERRAGQLLADMEKAKGGGDPAKPKEHRYLNGTGASSTLADIGISKNQSSTWQ